MVISDLEYVQPTKSSVQGGAFLIPTPFAIATVNIGANLLGSGFTIAFANLQLIAFNAGLHGNTAP